MADDRSLIKQADRDVLSQIEAENARKQRDAGALGSRTSRVFPFGRDPSGFVDYAAIAAENLHRAQLLREQERVEVCACSD